jgi:hypothetical protein
MQAWILRESARCCGILGFYMGTNTPERKDYIMENLVVPVED